MILRDILSRIETLYNRGVQTDDSRLSKRYIYNKLLTVRALLLTQKSNKKQELSIINYTTLDCVRLIDVDIISCPCLPPIGCKVLRTKYSIPSILSSNKSLLIKYIYNSDYTQQYNISNRQSLNVSKGNKYTKNNVRVLYEDNHLYIYGNKLPKTLNISYVANNPIESLNYPSLCDDTNYKNDCEDCQNNNNNCNLLDMEFPLEEDLIENAIGLIINELQFFSVNIEDKSNNTKEDERR